MASQKTYRAQNFDVNSFAQELLNYYQSEGYETQTVNSPGGIMVQARAKDSIKKMSVALTVTATVQGENVIVQAGQAKWGMNAAVAVAASIVFWPLLAFPIYTTYKQKQIIDESWQIVERYMLSIGATPAMAAVMATPVTAAAHPTPAGASQPEAALCPHCGKPVRAGAKFCDSCGKSLVDKCAKCGADLRPGAKFCDNCGTPTA
jgi:hypothetical protein